MSTATSVWKQFDRDHMGVMRTDARANHPTRFATYELIQREFGRRHFEWLDLGVVGMVDYERLVGRLRFTFTGADISPAILEDGRQYLRQAGDRLVLWNVEDAPEPVASLTPGRFDLVTARHVLNHCHYYEQPLAHIHRLLKDGGVAIVTLHLHLREHEDRLQSHAAWSVPGEVIGNYYNRKKFLRYLAQLFAVERFIRFDDGQKPNDVLLVRKRTGRAMPGPIPEMEICRPPLRFRARVGRFLPPRAKAAIKRAVGWT